MRWRRSSSRTTPAACDRAQPRDIHIKGFASSPARRAAPLGAARRARAPPLAPRRRHVAVSRSALRRDGASRAARGDRRRRRRCASTVSPAGDPSRRVAAHVGAAAPPRTLSLSRRDRAAVHRAVAGAFARSSAGGGALEHRAAERCGGDGAGSRGSKSRDRSTPPRLRGANVDAPPFPRAGGARVPLDARCRCGSRPHLARHSPAASSSPRAPPQRGARGAAAALRRSSIEHFSRERALRRVREPT